MTKRDIWGCQICGEEGFCENKVLLGGYFTKCCNECANSWNEFITDKAEYRQHLELDLLARVAVREKDEAKIAQLAGEKVSVERALYQLGKLWAEARAAEVVE